MSKLDDYREALLVKAANQMRRAANELTATTNFRVCNYTRLIVKDLEKTCTEIQMSLPEEFASQIDPGVEG